MTVPFAEWGRKPATPRPRIRCPGLQPPAVEHDGGLRPSPVGDAEPLLPEGGDVRITANPARSRRSALASWMEGALPACRTALRSTAGEKPSVLNCKASSRGKKTRRQAGQRKRARARVISPAVVVSRRRGGGGESGRLHRRAQGRI